MEELSKSLENLAQHWALLFKGSHQGYNTALLEEPKHVFVPHARSDDHNGFIWPWNLVNLCEAPSIAKYASCVNGQDFTSWLGFYVWSCTSAKTRLHLSSGKVCNPYRCMLLLDLLNNTPKWFDTILTILPKKNKNSVPVRNIVILKFLKGNGQMLELLTKQGSILMKLHTLKSKKKKQHKTNKKKQQNYPP